jgi:hypothetical protein
MHKSRWNLALGLALMVAVALACNWSTANISSLKISKDEKASTEVSDFKPGEKIYAVAQISNNPGKQKVKFRVLYDDVKGQKSGEMLPNGETTLDVDGDRQAYLALPLPRSGFPNGRYKVEVTMSNEQGEQKDQKSATFNVTGFTEGAAPSEGGSEEP